MSSQSAHGVHEGNVAEMKTGEGKTSVATLPTYLNALEERRSRGDRERLSGSATLAGWARCMTFGSDDWRDHQRSIICVRQRV